MNQDPYFNRHEVSNSDLGLIEKELMPRDQIGDIEAAYRFGTLVDAVITEPHRVDYRNLTCDTVQYTAQEFELARNMKKSFLRCDIARMVMDLSIFQHVDSREMEIEHRGFKFSLSVRCKWDFKIKNMNWGGDIKSTTAETQEQFIAALHHFKYPRQRAWYMDIAGADKDLLIGISKKNLKVFPVYITRDSEIYRQGKEQYQELAFKHYTMYHDFFSIPEEIKAGRAIDLYGL